MSREEQLYESIEFVKEPEDLPSQQEETIKKQEFLMQAQQHNGFHVEASVGLQKCSNIINAYLL